MRGVGASCEGDDNCPAQQRCCSGTCRADCELTSNGECGDSTVNAGEECDLGPLNSPSGTCTPACTVARCADGFVAQTEACDDGNTAGDDYCSPNCLTVLGSCGDGVKQANEACDDGPANSDVQANACRTTCALAACGDGVIDNGEPCDDGNSVDTDACVAECVVARCGDGWVRVGVEECESGPCCNLETCMIRVGTICREAIGACDATEYCLPESSECPVDGYSPSSTLCAAGGDSCNPPEYCSGTSAACPANVLATDGTTCADGICNGGQCRTRTTTGLVVLYDFEEGVGDLVYDVSNVTPAIELEMSTNMAAPWTANGALSLAGGRLYSTGAATKLRDRIVATGAFTIEAWIQGTGDKPTGTILSLPADATGEDLYLETDNGKFFASMRTSASGAGTHMALNGGTLAGASRKHVAFTRTASGARSLYVDGALVAEDTQGSTGSLAVWSGETPLVVGARRDGSSPWSGSLLLLAAYSRALSAVEVQHNVIAGAGQCGLGSATPVASRTWWLDADTDGFGGVTSSMPGTGCRPAGYVARALDCNDQNSEHHSAARDVCNNGVDDDCSGADSVCGSFVASAADLLVIEAEHYLTRSPDTGALMWQRWRADSASGGAAMVAWADAGENHGEASVGSAPTLAFPVRITRQGYYYLWVRGRSIDANSEDIHFRIQGQASDNDAHLEVACCGPWGWHSLQDAGGAQRARITFPSVGDHTLLLQMHEDGVAIDKIVLVWSASYLPDELTPYGPPESTVSP